MDSNICKNIITTVAYYDVMDYPLTAFEIWKYLIAKNNEDENRCSLAEVMGELESEGVEKYIENFQGFYFLRGRNELVMKRLERNKISEKKYKIILKAVKFLKFVPHIKMAAIAGRAAMKNAEKSSDIDLLLVFKKGHIFTGRFLTYLLLEILGKRRKGLQIKDKICLNHFLSDEHSISIKDLFSTHEYCFLHLIYNFNEYRKFLKNNEWISEYRPNFGNDIPPVNEIKDNNFSKITRNILEKILSFEFVETNLKKIQVAKIKANPKTQKAGGVIIYSDDELAFWPDFEKQGPMIYDRFKSKLAELGIQD